MSQTNPSPQEANDYAAAWIKKEHMQEAFAAAFPGSKASKQSQFEKSSKLHKHKDIKAAIAKLQRAAQRSAEKTIGITVEGIKKDLMKAVKAGLKLKKDAQGNKVAHNIAGAVSALSEINRMDGNHAAIKQEHYGAEGEPLPPSIAIVTTDPKEAANIYAKIIGSK